MFIAISLTFGDNESLGSEKCARRGRKDSLGRWCNQWASVNIAHQNGIRGMIQNAKPWLMWSWCSAYRLKLSCKNALAKQLFKGIEEMFICLYENPPRKLNSWEI